MSAAKTVKVRLKAGHPKRNMLARLADGRVIEIGEAGVDLAPNQISQEMRRCQWFQGCDSEVTDIIEMTPPINQGTGSENTDEGSADEPPAGDESGTDEDSAGEETGADQDTAEVPVEDPAVKAAAIAETAAQVQANRAAEKVERTAAATARKAAAKKTSDAAAAKAKKAPAKAKATTAKKKGK